MSEVIIVHVNRDNHVIINTKNTLQFHGYILNFFVSFVLHFSLSKERNHTFYKYITSIQISINIYHLISYPFYTRISQCCNSTLESEQNI